MNITISAHAFDRIQGRGIATEAEVVAAITRNETRISKAKREVRVLVKRLHVQTRLPDGSNGDLVLACIEPTTHAPVVKTVMLQRKDQAERKAHFGEAEYILR